MPTVKFPLARYRLEWQATTPLRLPDYAGSMLRGAFGHALRHLACMTRQKTCDGCPLLSSCPYPTIFQPPPPAGHALQKFSAIPVPYIIEPPEAGARLIAPGDTFSFGLVLIGRALRELPAILLAWRRALGRGVGAGDGTAELIRVVHCAPEGETEVYRPEEGSLRPHGQRIAIPALADLYAGPAAESRVTLHILTPLRLQRNGRALGPEDLEPRTLLMALARRASLLAEFHADGPLVQDFAPLVAASACIRGHKRLAWRDWTRYSSRQRQAMTLGGVVGEWTLEGPLGPLAGLLELGEWLHVGKEAAFGLGRYHLTPRTDISRANATSWECSTQGFERKEKITPPQPA